MDENQKKVLVEFMKKNKVKVSKNEKGYWVFTCACGSEMWNNMLKADKHPKAPDLSCKDKACPFGSKGFPYSVWVKDPAALEILSPKRRASSKNDTKPSTAAPATAQSGSFKDYGSNIPISMYAAWAKDVAVYLAKATNIQAHDDFDALYRTCLVNMEKTLKWYAGQLNKTEEKEDVKSVDELELDDDIAEPEDVDEAVKEVEDDEDFSDLDNIDI